MVEFLGNESERKLKLFSCACCRRVWSSLTDARSRDAVEVTERWLEGAAGDDALETAARAAYAAFEEPDRSHAVEAVAYLPLHLGWETAARIAFHTSTAHANCVADLTRERKPGEDVWQRACDVEQAAQTALVRDIFGNPFRPLTFSPVWRTDTAVALAKQMYESREFGAMPILADALQDAGCDNDDILAHCRDTSLTHVRGCWVTDLVLNKS
jgi:hypothetical protein